MSLFSILLIGLALPGPADEEILERAERALEARREVLTHYSVDVIQNFLIDQPNGVEGETREINFFGAFDEFRREVIRSSGEGKRLQDLGAQFQRSDILGSPGLLEESVVIGTTALESGDAVELQIRPDLSGLRVKKGRLFVDPLSGMPLRLQLEGEVGPLSNLRLTLSLSWDEEQRITLRRVQTLEISFRSFDDGRFERGFGRSGFRVRVSTTWSNYQWGQSFEPDFFRTEGLSRQRPTQQEEGPGEDPFEEIRPELPDSRTPRMEAENIPEVEEVLIQGASIQGGQVCGLGGGGIRGARIAGSRANRIQGSVNAGLSGSFLDARPYSLNGQEVQKADYLSWNAGVSLGGPLGSTGSSRGGFFFRQGGRRSKSTTSFPRKLYSSLILYRTTTETRASYNPVSSRSHLRRTNSGIATFPHSPAVDLKTARDPRG